MAHSIQAVPKKQSCQVTQHFLPGADLSDSSDLNQVLYTDVHTIVLAYKGVCSILHNTKKTKTSCVHQKISKLTKYGIVK